VNSHGQVVLNNRSETPQHALQQKVYLYENGDSTDIGSLGGILTVGNDINDAGTIVGMSSVSINGLPRAFLYKDGQMHNLGMLPNGYSSTAEGINSLGEVVGISSDQFGHYTAFVYRNDAMIDLKDEIPIGSGWQLLAATAIHDQGQIVGYGNKLVGANMVVRAFLLTPVPEPSTYALAVIGVVGLLALRHRKVND
jgi:probable HAF family extracellular repeat protein